MAVRRSVILAVVIIAALAVSAGYFVNSVSGGGGNNSVTIQVQVPPGGFGNYGNIDTYFPRNFTVTEGDHVTLVFENLDDDPHELTIPAFGVDTNVVPSGQTTRVSFVPTQTGVFEYFEPPGLCGNCTGIQEMTGNMTVLAR